MAFAEEKGTEAQDTNSDRSVLTGIQVLLEEYYRARPSRMPPGVMTRRASQQSSVERQVRQNRILPPDLQKQLHELPPDVERRLPVLPPKWARYLIGDRALAVDCRNWKIMEVVHVELKL